MHTILIYNSGARKYTVNECAVFPDRIFKILLFTEGIQHWSPLYHTRFLWRFGGFKHTRGMKSYIIIIEVNRKTYSDCASWIESNVSESEWQWW